jgi:hypothetical protein
MKKLMIVAAALAALAGTSVSRAEDAPADKTFPADKGPDSIDVSKYPKEQQENYKVFTEKCSRCHTLARPINSDYALPAEWTAYVDKMRHKPRSGISDDAQKAITDFLIYDSSIRKKDLIAKKLKDQAAAAGKDAAKPDAGASAGGDAPKK